MSRRDIVAGAAAHASGVDTTVRKSGTRSTDNTAAAIRLSKGIEVCLVLAALAGLLFVNLSPGGPFKVATTWLFDAYQRTWPPDRIGSDTAVIEIDDESIRRFGQWPWPRDKLARLVFAAREARVIGIDILLPDADRLAPGNLLSDLAIKTDEGRAALMALPDPDSVLASTLSGLPTVLAMTVDDDAPTHVPPVNTVTVLLRERSAGEFPALPRMRNARGPMPVLAHAARGLGVVSAARETSGEITELPAAVATDGSILPGFGVGVLAVARDVKTVVLNTSGTGIVSGSIGSLSFQTSPSGGIRPRYIDTTRLLRIPAYRMMDPAADLSLLKNRIAIIGVTARGIGETFQTPLGIQQSSLQIQAQLVESIIAGDTLYRPFWAAITEAGIALGLGLASALLLGHIPYHVHAVSVGAAAALLVEGSIAAFRYQDMLLDCILPVTCLLSTSILAAWVRFCTEGAIRRRRETELAVACLQREAARRELRLQSEADTLRHSLDFAVEAAQLGVWDADLRNGTWVHSHQHDQILGLADPPPSWSQAILLDRVAPGDLAAVRNGLAIAETSGTLDLECAITWADGDPHYIHVLGRIWSDANGRVIRVAGVVADITQLRSLENRVRQSEKMQAIGLLASGVAHNFNNLLMVVLGSLELAQRKDSGSKDESRLIGNAIVAAQKCADIARHLLAFGRSQPLRPTAANPMQLLLTVCEMLRHAMPDSIRVVLNAQSCLPNISIDPTELELALLNLAMNAKDAMPHGGRLDIRAFMQKKDRDTRFDGNYLVVEVADNGTGIPSDQLPKVFDPFFTTKEIGNGTGLGLSQVHGFVHQSGGAVEIESTVGRGTCVRIYLPKKAAEARLVDPSEAEGLLP